MNRMQKYMYDDLEREERLKAVEQFEQSLADQKKIPDRSRLPHRRAKRALQFLGAMALALQVAALTLLANFIIFNRVIHAAF